MKALGASNEPHCLEFENWRIEIYLSFSICLVRFIPCPFIKKMK